MNTAALRYLLAVRQHGSFAAAARALGVSQPNLSKSVSRLEDRLRGRIFLRTSTGAQLTPFGEVVAEHAMRVVSETQDLELAAQLAAGGPSSLLRLGFGPELKQTFAPRLLDILITSRPALNLRIEIGDRMRLLPALHARELDVIFTIKDEAVEASEAVLFPMFSSFPVAVAAPTHPLASERGITSERFLQFPHAGPRNAFFSWEAYFGGEASAKKSPGYEFSDFGPFMDVILAGRATIGMPAFAAEPFLASGKLVVLDVHLGGRLDYVGATMPAAQTSPIVRQLLKQARSLAMEDHKLRA